jgi:serine/threonine-protein kinase
MGELPRPGEVVLGRYRVEAPLASGGMGVVVRATHLGLNQPVALKFITPSLLDPAVAAERFLREARATFRLRSEFTVRVLDAGTLPNGAPVMVMELLEGMDLKRLIGERGPLPQSEAVLYAVQICEALGEAHALGIVHRDLKARNVFITKRVDGSPSVKVLDFGISKIADEGDGPLTAPDVALGSPRYMAPEQWQSAATVDARADIYALGAVVYEMLTGKIPLAGLPLEELIKRIAAGAIPSPRELRPDLSEPLARVVLKALRPHPDERFPTASHFAAALRGAVPAGGTDARPKPNFAMTAPTAVMNKEVMLARARIAAMPTGANAPVASEAVPSTDENPLSSTADDMPPLSSTVDEAPAALATVDERSRVPSFDDKTAVSKPDAPGVAAQKPLAATLPAASAPVVDQILAQHRAKMAAQAPAAPTRSYSPPGMPVAAPVAPPMPPSAYAPAPRTSPLPPAPPAPPPLMSMGVRNSAPPNMATVQSSAPEALRTQRSSYEPPPPAPPYVAPGRVASGTMPAYGPPPEPSYATHPSGAYARVSSPPAASGYVRVSAPPPRPAKSGRGWILFAVVLIGVCLAAGLALGLVVYLNGG